MIDVHQNLASESFVVFRVHVIRCLKALHTRLLLILSLCLTLPADMHRSSCDIVFGSWVSCIICLEVMLSSIGNTIRN